MSSVYSSPKLVFSVTFFLSSISLESPNLFALPVIQCSVYTIPPNLEWVSIFITGPCPLALFLSPPCLPCLPGAYSLQQSPGVDSIAAGLSAFQFLLNWVKNCSSPRLGYMSAEEGRNSSRPFVAAFDFCLVLRRVLLP